jgi:hypothetical protein
MSAATDQLRAVAERFNALQRFAPWHPEVKSIPLIDTTPLDDMDLAELADSSATALRASVTEAAAPDDHRSPFWSGA